MNKPLAWTISPWALVALLLAGNGPGAGAALPFLGQGLPKDDLRFLREMTRDVVEASRVRPGSNGGGRGPLTNSCGFTLITPGKDTDRKSTRLNSSH